MFVSEIFLIIPFSDERNGGYPLMFSWTKDVLYIIYFATILHTGLDYSGNGAIWGNQTSLPQIPAMEFKCGKPTSTTNFPKSILHLKCNVKLKQ